VHLAPDRKSNLAEVLQTASEWPVTEARSRAEIEAGHVYVIPPNRELTVEDGELRLDALPAGDPPPHTIDQLFRSLAASGRVAAAVVLSGGGSDGAAGLRAVKDAGGLVLVQDPADAGHTGMPRNALATGVVDATLPAAEMGPALLRMLRHGPDVPVEPDGLGAEDAERFEQILETVRNETGHDFSTYKRSTVLRRIRRRLKVRHVDSLGAYLDVLQQDESETDALFRELLIGVTRFFRDPEAYEALKQQVIPRLFDGKGREDTVRVWVVGCSTGEEVYSLAMLLREHAAGVRAAPDVQIFASDLSEEALQRARKGRYPASIASDVSETRLRRFFEKRGDTYRVKRSLREMVIFARHGVLRDPPFSRIDLVSCRNLLIYLRRDAQQNVLQTFHYALRPTGYLFLGTSETTGDDEHFRPVDSEHHLYQAREQSRSLPQLPMMQQGAPDLPEWDDASETAAGIEGSEDTLHREALEEAAPPSLLVNEHREVVHLSDRAGRFLRHPGGPLSSDLTELVRPALRPELSEALGRLFGSGEPTVARPVRVEVEGQERTVYLTVRPAQQEDGAETLALVLFNEGEATPETSAPGEEDGDAAPDGDDENARLRRQLRETRRRLRETRERFKTSREEMQAQNEELRSMNEEYKSATEELETSKEELQSVNEELETVNEELQQKLDEVSEAHSDLQNLVDATDIATIFLGEGLEIRRFTPPVKGIFSIRESDVGRPITELTCALDYDAFESDADQVLQDLAPVAREVRAENGDWYLVQVRPYRTVDDVIDGVVFTFIDITDQKETERRLREARDYAQSIVDTVREGLIVLDDDLRVVSANDSF
jgi:two-component system CheB/CheR fusion protein